MLYQLFEVSSADQISAAHIERLVTDAVPESQRLDFKRQLPTAAEKDKNEFLYDVAAMANGGGGAIVFGIDDTNDHAVALCPVSLGDTLQRLGNLIRARIEPPLDVGIHPVLATAGDIGNGYVVVHVPESPRRPFGVVQGNGLCFPQRAVRDRHWLTEHQVEQMYQDRFRRAADVERRLSRLRTDATQHNDHHPQVGRLYVSIVPMYSSGRLFRATSSLTRDIERGSLRQSLEDHSNLFNVSMANIIPNQCRIAFRSLTLANSFHASRLHQDGWFAIHDDGAFVAVLPGESEETDRLLLWDWIHSDDISEARGQGHVTVFRSTWTTMQIIRALAAYRWLASSLLHASGELVIESGYYPVDEADDDIIPVPSLLQFDDASTRHASPQRLYSLPFSTTVSADVSDLDMGSRLLLTSKILLDDIYSGFGIGECPVITDHGSISLRHIRPDLQHKVSAWAGECGVAITSE